MWLLRAIYAAPALGLFERVSARQTEGAAGPSEEAGLLSQAAERTLQRPSPFRRAGVPLPRVKSPPWHMNCEITRWKAEPLKCRGLPLPPMPFSPVHRARKFCGTEGRCAQSETPVWLWR